MTRFTGLVPIRTVKRKMISKSAFLNHQEAQGNAFGLSLELETCVNKLDFIRFCTKMVFGKKNYVCKVHHLVKS